MVNDGSTDDTKAILEQYTHRDKIRVYHNEENCGVGAAKDQAAANATGDYVAFLDDDDRWHPTKLEKQVKHFESLSDEYAVVQTAMENIQDGETERLSEVTWIGSIWPEILVKCLISFSTVMIRRGVLEEVGGFDPSFTRVVDWDLWIRVAKDYKFSGVDEVLTARYKQPEGITSDVTHGIEGRRLIWEKYQDEFQQHPECAKQFKTIWEQKKGFNQLRQSNQTQAVQHFWNVVRLDSASPRTLLWLAIAVFGRPGYRLAKRIESGIN